MSLPNQKERKIIGGIFCAPENCNSSTRVQMESEANLRLKRFAGYFDDEKCAVLSTSATDQFYGLGIMFALGIGGLSVSGDDENGKDSHPRDRSPESLAKILEEFQLERHVCNNDVVIFVASQWHAERFPIYFGREYFDHSFVKNGKLHCRPGDGWLFDDTNKQLIYASC